MCSKNFMVWKKKSKIPMTNKSLNYKETMLSYCLKCRKKKEKENLLVAMTQNGRIMGW